MNTRLTQPVRPATARALAPTRVAAAGPSMMYAAVATGRVITVPTLAATSPWATRSNRVRSSTTISASSSAVGPHAVTENTDSATAMAAASSTTSM